MTGLEEEKQDLQLSLFAVLFLVFPATNHTVHESEPHRKNGLSKAYWLIQIIISYDYTLVSIAFSEFNMYELWPNVFDFVESGSTPVNVSASTSAEKNEFVNAGQLSNGSPQQSDPHKQSVINIIAFLMHLSLLCSFWFL